MLALLSNATFRLIDSKDNEFAYDESGTLTAIRASRELPLVRSVSQGQQQVRFEYDIDPTGSLRVASTTLLDNATRTKPTIVARYQYDAEGRLARVVKDQAEQVALVTR